MFEERVCGFCQCCPVSSTQVKHNHGIRKNKLLDRFLKKGRTLVWITINKFKAGQEIVLYDAIFCNEMKHLVAMISVA
jgi:hypothetical protein